MVGHHHRGGQPHARLWAGQSPLPEPAADAGSVVALSCLQHHRIPHELQGDRTPKLTRDIHLVLAA
eukprot:scaffold141076_cov42-Prasinocladus_malaysianus.AAC.3